MLDVTAEASDIDAVLGAAVEEMVPEFGNVGRMMTDTKVVELCSIVTAEKTGDKVIWELDVATEVVVSVLANEKLLVLVSMLVETAVLPAEEVLAGELDGLVEEAAELGSGEPDAAVDKGELEVSTEEVEDAAADEAVDELLEIESGIADTA
jgi:hypothetical protein